MLKKIILASALAIGVSEMSFAQENLSGARVIIDNGNRYTSTNMVPLELFAFNATHMMVSNSPTFNGASWIRFDRKIATWQLQKADGKITVYAKFKDADGNESKTVKDEIILDSTPPENPFIKINSENGYLNTKEALKVDLMLSAVDAKYIIISNSTSFYGEKWRIYESELLDWELEEGEDGERSVYVKFKDNAQNISDVASHTIVVDREAPLDCSIHINNANDIYATDQGRKVTLHLFARNVSHVMVSEDESFDGAQWETYSTKHPFVLSEGDGEKTVYAKFKDEASNESEPVKDHITLDITPPQACTITIDNGASETQHINKLVTLHVTCEDAKFMMVSNSPTFQGARWMSFKKEVQNWSLQGEDDGERTVYVMFKDEAGNISKASKASIMLKRGIGGE